MSDTDKQITLPPRSEIVIDSLRPEQITRQMAMIEQVMKENMVKDLDYGIIPGTPKPTLLKPGAEMLRLLFFLSPKFEWSSQDMGNGHIEIEVKCTVTQIHTDKVWGEGLGSCSTMESKYRYRKDPSGKRLENPDIADQYNTVRKMAKKRAFVDAILTATSASHFFTQDIEDMKRPSGSSESGSGLADETGGTVLIVPPDSEGKQVWRATIAKVVTKSGTSQKTGQPWYRVSLLLPGDAGDYWVSTFDRRLGLKASTFDGKSAELTVRPGNKEGQWDLLEISAPKLLVPEAPAQSEETNGENELDPFSAEVAQSD